MTLAKRILTLEGTVLSVNITQEFKDKESGEITPKSFKLVFLEDISKDLDGTKTQQTAIKIDGGKEEELKKLIMKKVVIKNISYGKYKDNDDVFQEWLKCKVEDIKVS